MLRARVLRLGAGLAQVLRLFAPALVMGYVAVFWLLYPQLGANVGALSVVPVSVIAWRWGLKAGLLAGLLAFPLNTVLLNLMGTTGLDAIIRLGGVPRSIALVVTGAAIGRLRDLNSQLKSELSARRRAEESLRESERRYRALFEQSNDAVFIMDPETYAYLAVNQRAADMLGYEPGELLGLSFRDTVAPGEVPQSFDVGVALKAGQPMPVYERTRRRKDGTLFPVEINAQLVRDERGNPPYLQSIVRDITARKQAEAALRESEKRYRMISELISDYAYAVRFEPDGTSEVEWIIAESFTRITGYTPEEAAENLRREPRWTIFHPEDAEAARRALDEARAGRIMSGAYRFITKDGNERWLQIYRRPEWDADHTRVVRMYGVAQDITERKQAENDRLELALEKESHQALREFIGNMSHDLKTPLSIINTSLYLLERLKDPQRQQEKLETIRSQTQSLERFIQDILTLSRLDHVAELHYAPLDLNPLIHNAAQQLRPSAEKKGLTVTFDLGMGLPSVLVDKDEVHRVLVNLLENAVNYTPDDGAITVRTCVRTADVVLEVSDTGIGIADADLPHVFDRFFRADAARVTLAGGSGLGLAIVKKIVDMHGGKIDVESAPGQGATFRVQFPLAQVSVV